MHFGWAEWNKMLIRKAVETQVTIGCKWERKGVILLLPVLFELYKDKTRAAVFCAHSWLSLQTQKGCIKLLGSNLLLHAT